MNFWLHIFVYNCIISISDLSQISFWYKHVKTYILIPSRLVGNIMWCYTVYQHLHTAAVKLILIKYYFVPHVKQEMLTFYKILFCATCEEGNAYI